MGSQVVYLHIGAAKTGTTFVQDALWANRNELRANGVLLPGKKEFSRVDAARQLTHWDPTQDPRQPKLWKQISRQINRWRGGSVVLSQEYLSRMSSAQINGMLNSLHDAEVRVILTVRELGALIPAQWQTSIQQQQSWTLTEYAYAVADSNPKGRAKRAHRHFWNRQDYGAILARWGAEVGPQNLTVVTVPPAGADAEGLWERFCAACSLDAQRYPPVEASNPSLGVASAELIRRMNATDDLRSLERRQYVEVVNWTLSRSFLKPRRGEEGSLSLPDELRPWAVSKASEVTAALAESGARVVGDLAELAPPMASPPYRAPEDANPEDLLAAAVDGLAGLSMVYVEARWALAVTRLLRRWGHRWPRLASWLAALDRSRTHGG